MQLWKEPFLFAVVVFLFLSCFHASEVKKKNVFIFVYLILARTMLYFFLPFESFWSLPLKSESICCTSTATRPQLNVSSIIRIVHPNTIAFVRIGIIYSKVGMPSKSSVHCSWTWISFGRAPRRRWCSGVQQFTEHKQSLSIYIQAAIHMGIITYYVFCFGRARDEKYE